MNNNLIVFKNGVPPELPLHCDIINETPDHVTMMCQDLMLILLERLRSRIESRIMRQMD